MAAARARTRAEFTRDTSSIVANGLLEIDRELSQVNKNLDDEEKAMVRTATMGGTMAKKEVAEFNQDYDGTCNYCMEADSTADHVRWVCKHFQPKRMELDPDLAAIPLKYLTQNVRCGIAPAMKTDGEKTYWGGHHRRGGKR